MKVKLFLTALFLLQAGCCCCTSQKPQQRHGYSVVWPPGTFQDINPYDTSDDLSIFPEHCELMPKDTFQTLVCW